MHINNNFSHMTQHSCILNRKGTLFTKVIFQIKEKKSMTPQNTQ